MKRIIVLLTACFVFSAFEGTAGSADPAGAVSVKNPMELVQKASQFLAAADEQFGGRMGMLLSAGLMTPQLAALDTREPVTCQLYFAKPALQPVLFGTLRDGVNPVEFPFLPGQILVPHFGKGRSVIYYDKAFSDTAKNLTGREVILPEGDLSAVYLFRDASWNRGEAEQDDDFAKLTSAALHKAELSVKLPGRDRLEVGVELETKKDSGLFEFSNLARPILKERVKSLPKASEYVYAEIPKSRSFSVGFSVLLSRIAPDFSSADHIYGQFMNNVISEDHDTAIMFSAGEDCLVLSGLLPAGTPSRRKFETFLRENCERFEQGIFVFRGKSGEDIYAECSGGVVTLLVMVHQGRSEQVVPICRALRKTKPVLNGREFLVCLSRRPDGSYERHGTGSMVNGKFRLNLSFRPEDIRKIINSAGVRESSLLP